jgi:UDP-N-acetylglucosamine 1-carboxyvinyltransferase
MHQVIKIEGGHPLNGEILVSGAKNATVALIPAAILASNVVTIVGIPNIADVSSLNDLLAYLHVQVRTVDTGHIIIDPSHMENLPLTIDAVSKLRASYYFMGALLGKYRHVKIKMPGGCDLGPRPIDLHLKGFEALGATVNYKDGTYELTADKLVGAHIFLDFASVGATINIMMAATMAEGRTYIENAAREPEIIDVATLLNKMGAQIRGVGTNVITIDGVDSLDGCFHEIIPDRIEAGTFLIIAAAMGQPVCVNNVIPQHLEALISKLREMGIKMEVGLDRIKVWSSSFITATDVKTMTYPGFATDLQAPLTALLTQAQGRSTVLETIYKTRFNHCEQLNKMGANIDVTAPTAAINGPTPLHGTDVIATDLRCGASLVVAGLLADGITTIEDIHHIDRGYDDLDGKLRKLGAHIWRQDVE